ncbi:LuxR C-terminal-related transcriptional regulator [Quadrisphaera sp. INWT6]|uniref:LuxR C-terminal-related transcriptional regulator n=1 Tax=Quadrisphaera sp. INWT6 TaxID=2596917 RepID=UPI00189233CF|nr:LuxR C-terminal-related transcriptional regulator [Quadrisphaera sp. INWT6]
MAHRQVRVILLSPSGAPVVLVAEEELAALEQRAQRANAPALLTARERQVLLLIEQGHSTAGVAAHLGVAVGTAAQHLAAARCKYGARTSVQAAALARQAAALD